MHKTIFLLITSFLLYQQFAQTADQSLKIADVKVRLFFHHSGMFSDRLSGKEELWNTVIGEGWAREPSTAALVDISMKGLEKFDDQEFVELTVKNMDSKKILFIESQPVGLLSKTGEYHAPFWMKAIGCEPLQLVAQIKGSSEKRELVIPFKCGE